VVGVFAGAAGRRWERQSGVGVYTQPAGASGRPGGWIHVSEHRDDALGARSIACAGELGLFLGGKADLVDPVRCSRSASR